MFILLFDKIISLYFSHNYNVQLSNYEKIHKKIHAEYKNIHIFRRNQKNRHTHFSQNVYDGFQPHIKIYYFYNPWASFPSFS